MYFWSSTFIIYHSSKVLRVVVGCCSFVWSDCCCFLLCLVCLTCLSYLIVLLFHVCMYVCMPLRDVVWFVCSFACFPSPPLFVCLLFCMFCATLSLLLTYIYVCVPGNIIKRREAGGGIGQAFATRMLGERLELMIRHHGEHKAKAKGLTGVR